MNEVAILRNSRKLSPCLIVNGLGGHNVRFQTEQVKIDYRTWQYQVRALISTWWKAEPLLDRHNSALTFTPKIYHSTHVWLPAWKDKMNSRNEKCLYFNVWTHFKFPCLLLFGFTSVWNQDNFQMFKTTFLWSWAV